ncbi:pilin [Patescibacteria group bacterium]|nr:pilin [Patescibacteria group bacterium]
MKSLIKKTCGAFAVTAFFFNNALAQGGAFFDNPQGGTAPNVAAQGTLGQNITTIINYFLGLLGLIAVAMLIYAGVLMVTAGGNDEQVGKSKKIMIYAVVGIVIILLSYTIVTFVSSALG